MRKLLGALVVVGIVGVSIAQVLPAGATNFGNEGCTPGFWKTHTDVWEEYTTTRTLGSMGWTIPAELSAFSSVTILTALNGGGGPGLQGAATILFRAAVAAYLNAANEGLGYPLRRFVDTVNGPAMQTQIDAALASLDRDTMLDLATYLDGLNNLGSNFC